MTRRWGLFTASAMLIIAAGGCQQQSVAIVKSHAWAESNRKLVIDTHIHTTFSDGKKSIADIADVAVTNRCDAIAITDHGDKSEQAATEGYFSEIDGAGNLYPQLLILTGMEWNVPPYKGREHVNVLMSDETARSVLPGLKTKFDRKGNAGKALEWLATQLGSGGEAVLFYNHPSRKDTDEGENASDLLSWRSVNELVVGFEGGPGHQKADEGSDAYSGNFQPLDGWDPVVRIGGEWDGLLDAGHDVWAALATSDYHNEKRDYEPCAFSRTHVLSPDRSQAGLLAALRAGSFWADHGLILEQFKFEVAAVGLPRPAQAGEIAVVKPQQPLDISVAIERGAGARDSNLGIEVIGNCANGTSESVFEAELGPADNLARMTLDAPVAGADGASCYLRARVRKTEAGLVDLLAYSNPIRLQFARGIDLPVSLASVAIAAAGGGGILVLSAVFVFMRRRAKSGSSRAGSRKSSQKRSRRPRSAGTRPAAPVASAPSRPQVAAAEAEAVGYRYTSTLLGTSIKATAPGEPLTLLTRGRPSVTVGPGALNACRLLLNNRELSSVSRDQGTQNRLVVDNLRKRLLVEQKKRLGSTGERRVDVVLEFSNGSKMTHMLNYYYRIGNNRVTRQGFAESAQEALGCYAFLVVEVLGESVQVQDDAEDSMAGMETLVDDQVMANLEKPGQSDNVAAELSRLAEMKQQGLLTEDEFRKAKERILGL